MPIIPNLPRQQEQYDGVNMIEQFCDCQIKANEDNEDTWTCCAHLADGIAFECPCKPTWIKTVNGKLKMCDPRQYGCIDFEPIPNNGVNGDGI